MAWDRARAAKEEFEAALLRKKHVVGVGIAKKVVGGQETDEPCVVIFVELKLPKSRLRRKDLIPQTVGGVKTDVVETGEIRALGLRAEEEIGRTERWRPAPGGVSIGHYQITAGTLGAVVHRGGERLILSNNHVLANGNRAAIGDTILQPGPADGGGVADGIAALAAFVPIAFDPPPTPWRRLWERLLRILGLGSTAARRVNRVDAALARPLRDGDVSDEVLDIGRVSGTVEVEVGAPVRKSGRTTALTEGAITAIGATVRVNYGDRVATFREQLVAGAMSQSGDSGALLVDGANRAVGLLFAGSDRSTIVNPISAVWSALAIDA